MKRQGWCSSVAERPICNRQALGSSPSASSIMDVDEKESTHDADLDDLPQDDASPFSARMDEVIPLHEGPPEGWSSPV